MTLLRNQVVVIVEVVTCHCDGRVNMETQPTNIPTRTGAGKRKRDSLSDATETRSPRTRLSCLGGDDGAGAGPANGGDVPMTEEELDIEQHKQITSQRNFDKVNFGKWQIKTWYAHPPFCFVCTVRMI